MKKRERTKHNIVIIFDFLNSNDIFSSMSEYNEYISNFNIVKYEKLNLSQLYQELNKALHSNNVQSIWELSKVITRIHFKESEE